MDIYFYCEYNGCKNSGKPVNIGTDSEYLAAVRDGALAIAGTEEGDFSGSAICLGNFDGVHIGHRALFEAAKKHKKWGVLLFDRNTKGSTLLTTQSEKIKIISELGADFTVIAEFSEKFSHKSPEEFVEFLKNILKVNVAVAGYDYRFGHMASGGKNELLSLCEKQKPILTFSLVSYIIIYIDYSLREEGKKCAFCILATRSGQALRLRSAILTECI